MLQRKEGRGERNRGDGAMKENEDEEGELSYHTRKGRRIRESTCVTQEAERRRRGGGKMELNTEKEDQDEGF